MAADDSEDALLRACVLELSSFKYDHKGRGEIMTSSRRQWHRVVTRRAGFHTVSASPCVDVAVVCVASCVTSESACLATAAALLAETDEVVFDRRCRPADRPLGDWVLQRCWWTCMLVDCTSLWLLTRQQQPQITSTITSKVKTLTRRLFRSFIAVGTW